MNDKKDLPSTFSSWLGILCWPSKVGGTKHFPDPGGKVGHSPGHGSSTLALDRQRESTGINSTNTHCESTHHIQHHAQAHTQTHVYLYNTHANTTNFFRIIRQQPIWTIVRMNPIHWHWKLMARKPLPFFKSSDMGCYPHLWQVDALTEPTKKVYTPLNCPGHIFTQAVTKG